MPTTTQEKKKVGPKDDFKGLDVGTREGQYWAGWSATDLEKLIKALRPVKRDKRTNWENDLLYSDDVMKGKASPFAASRTKVLEQEHLSHKLPRELRKKLAAEKVQVIVNRSSKNIVVDMPGGSGCTMLIMPGTGTGKGKLEEPGFHVVNAYQEAFIDRDALMSAGLSIEDYDPKIHGARSKEGMRPYVGKNPKKRRKSGSDPASLDTPLDPRLVRMEQVDNKMLADSSVREMLNKAIREN